MLPYQYQIDYSILPELEKDPTGKDIYGKIVVENKVQMSGKHVTRAYATPDQTGQWMVNLEFDAVGKQQFGDVTSAEREPSIGHRAR